ncbi:amino acid ABC transporter permease [Aestuariivirga sp.]|uniref:amino acid ABC transporter permease n=1 Tax=Aestuariivirga sp. TaxID=2650926 RepID=UPI00359410B2
MTDARSIGYVRTEDAPILPPPPGTAGVMGWLRQNLFPSFGNAILTIVIGLFLALVAWSIIDWAIIRAVWSGVDRESCAVEGAGACWPFVWAKFPQWLYGFYTISERWRPSLLFVIAVVALIPMLMPSAPYKQWNALFLLVVFPVIGLILLSGGNFDFSWSTYAGLLALGFLGAVLIPFFNGGIESGIKSNVPGVALALIALLPAMMWFVAEVVAAAGGLVAIAIGFNPLTPVSAWLLQFNTWIDTGVIPLGRFFFGFALAAGLVTFIGLFLKHGAAAFRSIIGWGGLVLALLAILLALDIDFGLVPVETANWGGLLVTLVVSVTGIVASLPLGILLALGRRSRMPIVRLMSIVFIEIWRGVPLITVLFMASVMLPLFFPEGTSFDKLLRALIGISLFSAAYMAEVVRGGLQAIGKGQYEGAMALGLSYWQMMGKIILPQALKISIPNIVGNFIGLFKDTTLVLIIGIYDFLGIITAGTQDAKWASPQTGSTGYFAAAIIYWAFCFGMSRYATYTEQRLNTGHKR